MRRYVWGTIIALTLPAPGIVAGTGAWPFELAYHFLPHLALAALGAGLLFLGVRRRAPAFAAAVLAAVYGVNALSVQDRLFAAEAQAANPGASATLDLISFNLQATDRPERVEAIMAWLSGGPAEVVVLLEASADWRAGLETLREAYPHQAVALPGPGADAVASHKALDVLGVAVLSRRPFGETRLLYPAGPTWPAVLVEFDGGGRRTTLAAVHPPNPLTPGGLKSRDRYLGAMAAELRGARGPVIVAGDFNATPFAPAFQRFVETLSLDFPRWPPATFPALLGPLGIPIDHVLTRGARIERLGPLPARGSDHRGLLARIALPTG